MADWYSTSYRKLFFDFHSAGAAEGLASAFDAERWADRLVEANAQAVSVFTKCGFGYSFYRKGSVRYPHPHLPEGLDMLGAQVDALHRRGLKAIGYYHTFNSEPIARDHPDWIERDAEGKPRGISICLLSPLLEEWMLPHVREIVTLYDVDSMFFDGTYAHSPCFCPACRQRFAEAAGEEIPKDHSNPVWPRFVAWKMAELKRVRRAICDAIHACRPEVVVSFNWCYGPRQVEDVPEGVGALVADIHPDDQVFTGSYLSAYWATLARPFDVMNSAFLQWWGDWGCKPAVAMQQEVASTLAHGGLTWIGYQMTQAFDVAPAVMGELGKTLAWVKEREPLLEGAVPVPNVAVLHSTASPLLREPAGFFADEVGLHGAHRILTESMIPYHIVHEAHLLAHLGDYRAVILPDQRQLSPALAQALGQWVEAGGVLLATALTGTLAADGQPTGHFALEDLLGVRYESTYDQTHAYIEVTDDRLKPGTLDMPHLAEAVFAFVRPVADDVETLANLRRIYLRADGKPLLRWSPPGEETGRPAITLRRVGKGWAAYSAGEVFRAYQAKNQWNLKAVVANLLGVVMPEPVVSVDAPDWLEVVLMRQGGRLLVHLVNQHGDRPLDGNYRCTERVVPLRDITVRVRPGARPSRVTLEPGSTVPEWQYRDGVLTVRVPEVHIHSAAVIE